MAEHDRTPVLWGAMIARDENDQMTGYQAFRIERATGRRTLVGEVRDKYQEAAQDARDCADKEKEVS